MSEEKKCECCCDEKEELTEEELDKVAGGYMKDGIWHCEFCGVAFPDVKTNRNILDHYLACDKGPYYKKK